MKQFQPVALAAALACVALSARAQTTPSPSPAAPAASQPAADATTLPAVKVTASADASAEGLSPAYAGGQVARGGRAGILGTKDNLETPFSITAYTNELIQDRQARSVGDVLQNDPTVRVARGFGNFQEAYFIRGFTLSSDDIAYNGLYSLLPRQYIATELFERVEVMRGASAFLTGANPGGGGIGGAINLVPKRAGNEPLTRVTAGYGSGDALSLSADVSRRFGPDDATGVRVNAAGRSGGTAVDDEKAKLGLLSAAVDWRSRDVRLSADVGLQDNRLSRTRTNVTLGTGVLQVPGIRDTSTNWAQPWSYSKERDVFSTLRGEVDVAENVTLWGAYGLRRSRESNSLANLTLTNASTGAGTTYRADNRREDSVDTGEVGARGKARTGVVSHDWVVAASRFTLDSRNAYSWATGTVLATNFYDPVDYTQPALPATTNGGDLTNPRTTTAIKLTSIAFGDTLGFLDNQLLLTLGVRQQRMQLSSYSYLTEGATSAYDKSHTSPAVGVVYRVTPQLSAYANYVEGLTRGDTAPASTVAVPLLNPTEMLAPYVSKQQEIGVKFDGGKFGGGLALFSTTKPRSLVKATTGGNVFTSEGEDRHQGVELTLQGAPLPSLRVLGGATWLDATQKSTGVATTEGKRVIGVAEWQGTLGAEWDVFGVQGLAVDGRVVYTGDRYANAANTIEVPGYTRLDIGGRYLFDFDGKPVTLRARIDNVTDKAYWASVGGYPNAGYLVMGQPRTFNLSASVDF